MDLSFLPTAEDDEFEFKSSATNTSELAKKLAVAGSAFSNTGGGWFIAGVDDRNGDADGGFAPMVGRQDLRDWVDTALHKIEPAPMYQVELITDAAGRGIINEGNVVLAVRFAESFVGPHMSFDNKYYIRAGAHTLPARHFIVESIRAKRHVATPRLIHVVNVDPHSSDHSTMIIDLIAISDAPALNVVVDLDPAPPENSPFPINATLIDPSHHFAIRFDIPNSGFQSELRLAFTDVLENSYSYQASIDSEKCVPAQNRGSYPHKEIANAIKELNSTMDRAGGGLTSG